MTKGSRLEVCWIWKLMVEEVALMPATVPLSLMTPLAMVVPAPIKSKPGAKAEAPVPPLVTAKVPVKLGTKVKVLAVVVLMEIKMLVSEEVATWIRGPVMPEIVVRAAVK